MGTNDIAPIQRRGRGRPRSGLKKVVMTISLPEETFRKLDEYARDKRRYKGDVVRDLINSRFE